MLPGFGNEIASFSSVSPHCRHVVFSFLCSVISDTTYPSTFHSPGSFEIPHRLMPYFPLLLYPWGLGHGREPQWTSSPDEPLETAAPVTTWLQLYERPQMRTNQLSKLKPQKNWEIIIKLCTKLLHLVMFFCVCMSFFFFSSQCLDTHLWVMSQKGAEPESKGYGQFYSNEVLVSLFLSLIIACRACTWWMLSLSASCHWPHSRAQRIWIKTLNLKTLPFNIFFKERKASLLKFYRRFSAGR